jgi:hypothetical protein
MTMSWNARLVSVAGLFAGIALMHSSISAQVLPVCSWPLETTGSGITNVAYPDTNATYWTMPFDSDRWHSIVIKGTYAKARFFSFVSYVAQGSVVANNGSLNDVDIDPDPGSTNPFKQGSDPNAPHFYTVTASRSATGSETNFLQLGDTRLVWIIYRIYVPDAGLDRQAGAPLPTITVIGKDNRPRTVAPCPSRDPHGAIGSLRAALLREGFGSEAAILGKLGTSLSPGKKYRRLFSESRKQVHRNSGPLFPARSDPGGSRQGSSVPGHLQWRTDLGAQWRSTALLVSVQ